jgi:hypothetical protein
VNENKNQQKGNQQHMTTTEQEQVTATEAELRELGLTAAADTMKRARELARKLRIAFEHFRVVTPEHLQRFQYELLERGRKGRSALAGLYEGYTYQALKFTALESYPNVPPGDVLEKIRSAKELKCFDRFEVLTLETREVVPDPVVFGIIDGCDNKYFVAQWDDDVKIEQILREDEG